MKKGIAKIRAPRGFNFQIKKLYGSIYVNLHRSSDNMFLGRVNLCNRNGLWYETHSSLLEEYHNKGLGALMYARAIQWCLENGFKVRSSGSSSEKAQRVWRGKSIRDYFNIRTKKVKYNGKHDPDCDTFFAYPK